MNNPKNDMIIGISIKYKDVLEIKKYGRKYCRVINRELKSVATIKFF